VLEERRDNTRRTRVGDGLRAEALSGIAVEFDWSIQRKPIGVTYFLSRRRMTLRAAIMKPWSPTKVSQPRPGDQPTASKGQVSLPVRKAGRTQRFKAEELVRRLKTGRLSHAELDFLI
jgi:hypothetical protein